MDRRNFSKILAALNLNILDSVRRFLVADSAPAEAVATTPASAGADFPKGKYTPFGYLDNPYHFWALHPSGVLRSAPAVGFGLYFPAGPGGYFDYDKNSVYRIFLRLGFRLGGRVLFEPKDFSDAGVKLISSHHSKNILTYSFSVPPITVTAPFFLVGENTMACALEFENSGAGDQEVEVRAIAKLELGASAWWGRDGIAGYDQPAEDLVHLRSFAAGPVFALKCVAPSSERLVSDDEATVAAWVQGKASTQHRATAYFPKALTAGSKFLLRVPAHGAVQRPVYLSRSVDERRVAGELRAARAQASDAFRQKREEDARFWSRAPRLEGDFPGAWKNSWVYDFETLRMMVRRPLGLYRHSWDAMQIQAPRNVLAETSIDMWTLSYADEETAKAVLLGQFQDALEPNVPCMREDGTMNMVAADGSECGTALQWCYPFYCLESVFLRTLDRSWLSALYPCLAAYLEWTLKNRRDPDGWIVAKCSWETGMDASSRFLLQQPTGGELIEFVRVAELQAAMSHAARAMRRFAEVLGKAEDFARWDSLASTYAEKTRQLWHEDWFYDVDARSGRPIVIPGHREVTQVGPVMCGVATAEQVRALIPKMREYETNQKFWLEWPSHVLPYLESVWRAGDREFLSRVLFQIIDRVYASMDRRELGPEKKLGWPGVSCEVWGVHGAYGGEGYGWGASLPAHIIRNLIGFRELEEPRGFQFVLGPNLPEALLAKGKIFRLRSLHYRGQSFDLHYETGLEGKFRVELQFAKGTGAGTLRATDENGASVSVSGARGRWSFIAKNHALYRLELVQ